MSQNTLLAAFPAGLLGGGHCAAMCGGTVGAVCGGGDPLRAELRACLVCFDFPSGVAIGLEV